MKIQFGLRKIIVNEAGRRYEVTLKAGFSHIKNEQQFRNRVRIAIAKVRLQGGDYVVYAEALEKRPILEVADMDFHMLDYVREL